MIIFRNRSFLNYCLLSSLSRAQRGLFVTTGQLKHTIHRLIYLHDFFNQVNTGISVQKRNPEILEEENIICNHSE